MKHFLALILVVALALSLAACGDNNHAVLPSIPSDGSDVLETDFQKKYEPEHLHQYLLSVQNHGWVLFSIRLYALFYR